METDDEAKRSIPGTSAIGNWCAARSRAGWYHACHLCSSLTVEGLELPEPEALPHANVAAQTVGAGKKNQ